MVNLADTTGEVSSGVYRDVRRAFVRRAVEKFLDDSKNNGIFMLVAPEDQGTVADAIYELLPKYEAMGKGGLAVIRGWDSRVLGGYGPLSVGKVIRHMDALCKKPEELAWVWNFYMSPWELVCQFCDYGFRGDNSCPFYAQKRGPHKVRFYPLGFLQSAWYAGARRVVIDPGSSSSTKKITYRVSSLRSAADDPRHARWRSALLATAKDLEQMHPELTVLPIPQVRQYFEVAGLPTHPVPSEREDWGLTKEEQEAEEAGENIRYLLQALNRVGRAALHLQRCPDDPRGDILEVLVPRQPRDCLKEQRVILLSEDMFWIILPTFHGLRAVGLHEVIDPRLGLVLRKVKRWVEDQGADGGETHADVEFGSKGITVVVYRTELGEKRVDLESFTVGQRAGAGQQTLERLMEAAEVLLGAEKEVSVATLSETTDIPPRTVRSWLPEVADAVGAQVIGKRNRRLAWQRQLTAT